MGVFEGTATFNLVGSYSKASDLGTLAEAINYTNSPVKYTNGTGANQVNAFWSDTRTLTATSESFDLDLASGAGSIIDKFGDQLVFTKIKQLFIRNRSTTTLEKLLVSGDFLGSALVVGTEHIWKIGPGGSRLIDDPIDGMAITAGSGDGLTVNAGAFTISYDILILGTV